MRFSVSFPDYGRRYIGFLEEIGLENGKTGDNIILLFLFLSR